MSRELARARRFHQELCFMFVDVDRFKEVNDRHGHATGDQVLRAVARVLRTSIRPQDVVGRYGGDEFVAGLVGCSLQRAVRIGERIRRAVASIAAAQVPPARPISVSIGLAASGATHGDVAELLEAADRELHRAKRAGRNRVSSSPNEATAGDAAGGAE